MPESREQLIRGILSMLGRTVKDEVLAAVTARDASDPALVDVLLLLRFGVGRRLAWRVSVLLPWALAATAGVLNIIQYLATKS